MLVSTEHETQLLFFWHGGYDTIAFEPNFTMLEW